MTIRYDDSQKLQILDKISYNINVKMFFNELYNGIKLFLYNNSFVKLLVKTVLNY